VSEHDQGQEVLSPNDLNALAAIIHFYQQYQWNRMAPSAKRSRLSLELFALAVTLSLLPEGDITMLEDRDLDHIDGALTVFLFEVGNKLSASEGKGSMLERCHRLKAIFAELTNRRKREREKRP
jgi:hypothetical protein